MTDSAVAANGKRTSIQRMRLSPDTVDKFHPATGLNARDCRPMAAELAKRYDAFLAANGLTSCASG
jgi:hypothetical protein